MKTKVRKIRILVAFFIQFYLASRGDVSALAPIDDIRSTNAHPSNVDYKILVQLADVPSFDRIPFHSDCTWASRFCMHWELRIDHCPIHSTILIVENIHWDSVQMLFWKCFYWLGQQLMKKEEESDD